jgi:GR25 family glycosyltransferase involved in LPS biosynthesis
MPELLELLFILCYKKRRQVLIIIIMAVFGVTFLMKHEVPPGPTPSPEQSVAITSKFSKEELPIQRNVTVFHQCLHEHLLPWVGKKSQRKVLGELIDHIYVLTTVKGDRSLHMQQRLGKILPAGWEELDVVSFITIGDLAHFTVGMWHCFQAEYACQSAGPIALSSSFYAAHYSAVYHSYERIMILEDDVIFETGFVDLLQKQIDTIEKEPLKRYIRADPAHLQQPKELAYFTPTESWDQLMLSQLPHVECPAASEVASVCYMPGRTPSRGMAAAVFSAKGSQKWLQTPIVWQSDWQNDYIAKQDESYTGFWGVPIRVKEDHSGFKKQQKASWRGNSLKLRPDCILSQGPDYLARLANPINFKSCVC